MASQEVLYFLYTSYEWSSIHFKFTNNSLWQECDDDGARKTVCVDPVKKFYGEFSLRSLLHGYCLCNKRYRLT